MWGTEKDLKHQQELSKLQEETKLRRQVRRMQITSVQVCICMMILLYSLFITSSLAVGLSFLVQ